MRQLILSFDQPARVIDVPVPALKPNYLLVRTCYSAVSVGTEKAAAGYGYMNIVEKVRSRPEQLKKIIESVRKTGLGATLNSAKIRLNKWIPTGYSCSGIVAAVGSNVSEYHVGDRVACGGGQALHAQYCSVPKMMAVRVPEDVSLVDAAFTTIGSIAMHAFRLGEVSVCDRVAVIGLGIVGQLLCQIAAAAGAEVTALDVDHGRIELARAIGAGSTIHVGDGCELERGFGCTDGRGFDAVFITAATASSDPVRMATHLARVRGKIIVVGDVGLDLDRRVLYAKEIALRVSRSYGPGRYDPAYEEQAKDYPFAYVRWTEQRNFQSFIDLLHRGSVKLEPLITHRFPIEDAPRAFELLLNPPSLDPPLGVVLEFGNGTAAPLPSIVVSKKGTPANPQRKLGFALIGPGSFASATLLPAFMKENIDPLIVAGTSGLAATELATRYGFRTATTDIDQVLSNEEVQAVAIATRHESHAELVSRALESGKSVFVEKPLATTISALYGVCNRYNNTSGSVMVGFNRRFAPFSIKAKSFFGKERGPLVINIRVNAGRIPRDHWTLSSTSGGGRIVGEGCHFVDLIQYFASCPIIDAYAQATRTMKDDLEENLSATLTLEDGSIATFIYTAMGDSSLPKEYIEIFCDGKVSIITDFRELSLISNGKVKTHRSRQDKGIHAEVHAFCEHVLGSLDCPIPFEESVRSMLATFALIESCRTGVPVKVPSVTDMGSSK